MSIPQEMARELVRHYGTINRASRKADIPLTTLYRLYSGEREESTFSTMLKMADGLNEDLPDLIRRLRGDSDGDGSR